MSTTQTLPELTGSDKQVAWATRIRAQVLVSEEQRLATRRDEIARERASYDPTDEWDAEDLAELDDFAAKLNQAEMFVRTQTSASFWIDHKDMVFGGLVQQIADQIQRGTFRG